MRFRVVQRVYVSDALRANQPVSLDDVYRRQSNTNGRLPTRDTGNNTIYDETICYYTAVGTYARTRPFVTSDDTRRLRAAAAAAAGWRVAW